jgi:hypothetical protein
MSVTSTFSRMSVKSTFSRMSVTSTFSRISVTSTFSRISVTSTFSRISVTSTFSRIYGRILAKLVELEHKDMEMEEQACFRTGRSCVDNIFRITQIIEEKKFTNRELIFSLFIPAVLKVQLSIYIGK